MGHIISIFTTLSKLSHTISLYNEALSNVASFLHIAKTIQYHTWFDADRAYMACLIASRNLYDRIALSTALRAIRVRTMQIKSTLFDIIPTITANSLLPPYFSLYYLRVYMVWRSKMTFPLNINHKERCVKLRIYKHHTAHFFPVNRMWLV